MVELSVCRTTNAFAGHRLSVSCLRTLHACSKRGLHLPANGKCTRASPMNSSARGLCRGHTLLAPWSVNFRLELGYVRTYTKGVPLTCLCECQLSCHCCNVESIYVHTVCQPLVLDQYCRDGHVLTQVMTCNSLLYCTASQSCSVVLLSQRQTALLHHCPLQGTQASTRYSEQPTSMITPSARYSNRCRLAKYVSAVLCLLCTNKQSYSWFH